MGQYTRILDQTFHRAQLRNLVRVADRLVGVVENDVPRRRQRIARLPVHAASHWRPIGVGQQRIPDKFRVFFQRLDARSLIPGQRVVRRPQNSPGALEERWARSQQRTTMKPVQM